MKKLIFFSAITILFASCVKDSEEYKKLKSENDSLVLIDVNKDKEIENYFKTINEISDNFEMITASESLITAESSKEHIKDDAAQRIKDNLQLMTQTLQKNREKIAMLEQQAKKSGKTSSELQRTIKRLMDEMQSKANAIDSLTTALNAKDERIFQLDKEVGRLSDDNIKKAGVISEQADALSSAWYVFGTKKELKAQKILTKNGLFSSTKVLQKEFDHNSFVKIDIRATLTIPLYCKKAKMMTSHPSKSYEFTTENGTKVLHIKDANEFWSISKYLVIQTD